MKEVRSEGRWVLLAGLTMISVMMATAAAAHEVAGPGGHEDPTILTLHWRTWLHLTVQWAHLIAFALWVGLICGTLLLRARPSLDHLLYASWALFLLLLATGTYNMAYSTAFPVSVSPSLLEPGALEGFPYAKAYTVVLTAKVGLFALAVLLTLVVTWLRLRTSVPARQVRLRQGYLYGSGVFAILTTLAAAVLLFYHEVADLWPTVIHSLGGVLGPEGPRGVVPVGSSVPVPDDFRHLASKAAWIDIGLRWVHLLGFGLWLGGIAVAWGFGGVSSQRFLVYTWVVLTLQFLTGFLSMDRWTPFYLPPYVWNLGVLSHVRFGRTYTILMTVKQGLVLAVLALTVALTLWLRSGRRNERVPHVIGAACLIGALTLGLVIAYVAVLLLFVHEGVDHAL